MTVRAPDSVRRVPELERGHRVDRYVVQRVVGRGATGVVYAVEHESLGISRALKVLGTRDPALRRRLLREGRIQAGLTHPNVVSVHDTFEVEGQPALLLDLVEGPSLDLVLRQSRPDLDASLRIFRGVLAGVAAAHAAGVVHRDLKPANVLLDTACRPPEPRVTDFGIARILSDASAPITAVGGFMGTLGYSPPEQYDDPARVGAPGDVYALGVLLYRLVCGVHPFPTGDPVALVQAMSSGEYRSPTEVVADLPADVVRAIDVALRPDPAERPQDASVLGRILGGEQVPLRAASHVPVRAAGTAPGDGVAPAWRAGAAIVTVLALAAAGGWWWQAGRSDLARRGLQAATLDLRALQIETTAPSEALALTRAAVALRGEDRVAPADLARWLSAGAAAHHFPVKQGAISVVGLAGSWLVAGHEDGGVHVYDVESGAEVGAFDAAVYRPTDMWVDPAGRWVALLADSTLGVFESDTVVRRLPDGAPLLTLSQTVRSIQLSKDASVLAALTDDPDGATRIEVWSVEDQALLWSAPHRLAVPSTLSIQGDVLMVVEGATGYFADLFTGARRADVERSDTRMYSSRRGVLRVEANGLVLVDFDGGSTLLSDDISELSLVGPGRDGRYLATRNARAEGTIYDMDELGREWSIGRVATFEAGASAPLLLGYRNGRVMRWDQGPLATYDGLPGRVLALVDSPEGRVAASSLAGGLATWAPDADAMGVTSRRNVSAGVASWDGETSEVLWIDGRRLRASRGSEQVQLAELPGRPVLQPMRQAGRAVVQLAEGFAVVSPDGSVELRPWQARTRRSAGPVLVGDRVAIGNSSQVVLVGPGGAETSVSVHQLERFAPDGTGEGLWVAHGRGPAMQIGLLDASGDWVRALGHDIADPVGVSSMRPAADGSLAVGTFAGHVLVWGEETAPRRVLGPIQEAVGAVALHPDGEHTAAGGWAGVVHIWRGAAKVAELDLGRQIADMAWSPGGAWLAVTDTLGRLHLLDPHGQRVAVHHGHGHVGWVRWRDDDTVVTLGDDGQHIVWSVDGLRIDRTSLAASGALTNLRVCPDSTRVVPVTPYPDPASVWAPAGLCAE